MREYTTAPSFFRDGDSFVLAVAVVPSEHNTRHRGVPMISPSGTFDYLVIVPEARSEGGFEYRAESRRYVSGSPLLSIGCV